MNPKVAILGVIITAVAAGAVWIFSRVINYLGRERFKCAHCRRSLAATERDDHFTDGICKTCGEYLIPPENRTRRN